MWVAPQNLQHPCFLQKKLGTLIRAKESTDEQWTFGEPIVASCMCPGDDGNVLGSFRIDIMIRNGLELF